MQIPTRCATGLLILALFALSGCVWLRLLELKGQFADFDRYIEVPPGAGVELRFRQPVLLEEDLTFLIKAKPTAQAQADAANTSVRIYAFAHVPVPGVVDPPSAAKALFLTMGVRGGKLVFVSFPDEVFAVIPRELALRGMRALGRAAVDQAARSATAAVDLAGVAAALPTREALIALFGEPNQRSILADPGPVKPERLLWRFELRGESLRTDGKPVVAAIAFVFAPGAAQPQRFQANLGGMWLYLDLPQPEPKPAAQP